MKRLLAVLLLLSFVSSIQAQKHSWGFSGGYRFTKIEASSGFEQTAFRVSNAASLFYRYHRTDNIFLQAAIQLQPQGFADSVIFTDEFGVPTGDYLLSKYVYNYLALPLGGGYTAGNTLRVEGIFLLSPMFLYDAFMDNQTFNAMNQPLDATERKAIPYVARFNLLSVAQLNFVWQVNPGSLVFLETQFYESLFSFTKKNYFTGEQLKHLGLGISVGFRFFTKAKKS